MNVGALNATIARLTASAEASAKQASDLAAQASELPVTAEQARLMNSASEHAGRAAALRYAIRMLEQHT